MQNSGKTKFKRTSIDRLLNFLIIGVSTDVKSLSGGQEQGSYIPHKVKPIQTEWIIEVRKKGKGLCPAAGVVYRLDR